jgi:hypothetical protein
MGMKALLNKAGFSKRSGTPIYELIYVLVLWVWLKKDSIGMFARESFIISPVKLLPRTWAWMPKMSFRKSRDSPKILCINLAL